jgi:MFS family permease
MRRAVWWLGGCQCVFWGVLYYGFSVALRPLELSLGVSRPLVAGAFSLGLLTMALLAPQIGRWLDQGHGVAIVRIGAALAIAGLLGLSQVGQAWQLYAVWAVLGLAMAALLYESAFALVSRAFTAAAQRLHALAVVTVMGGLASTVFLPVLALVTEHAGWRAAQVFGAGAVLLAAVAMERCVLPVLPQHAIPCAAPQSPRESRRDLRFLILAASFASATVASMAVTTLLIPMLLDRSVDASIAATTLATLGIAQLPGRLWMLRAGAAPSARSFAMLPLVLQAAGLLGIAISPNLAWTAAGVGLFGLGSGLHTLARPWMVLRLYGVQRAGYWNGQIAHIQGFGRALGPLLAVGLAVVSTAPAVLAGLSAVLLLLALINRALLRESTEQPQRNAEDGCVDGQIANARPGPNDANAREASHGLKAKADTAPRPSAGRPSDH